MRPLTTPQISALHFSVEKIQLQTKYSSLESFRFCLGGFHLLVRSWLGLLIIHSLLKGHPERTSLTTCAHTWISAHTSLASASLRTTASPPLWFLPSWNGLGYLIPPASFPIPLTPNHCIRQNALRTLYPGPVNPFLCPQTSNNAQHIESTH